MQKVAMDRNLFMVFTGGLLGSILEWYDLTIYLFSPTKICISQCWWHMPFLPLVLSCDRLVLFFGHYGDRIGRRKILIFTILVMSMSTVMIDFLPLYSSVGILSPLLLILLRVVQGFLTAGESGGGGDFYVRVRAN